MLPIRCVHQDLVVPGEGIHEAEHLMTGRGVDQQIYARQRIVVLGASSVQVRVIDTESPFAIVLADEAQFIKNVNYPKWLSNVVLVRKNNGKWQLCVDYSDLNRACPKDSYPLPHIDLLVDATAGHQMLRFMGA